MSISNSLSNALSGMTAASRLAEVTSSNVANALTDGYGRRTLNLSSAVVAGRGAGVEVGSVMRHVDRGILADRRLADAAMGQFGSLVSTMGRVEDIVGVAGQAGSISSRIVAVESALVDAAADPSSNTRLSSLADSLKTLTNSLNTASDDIQRLRADSDASIADQVQRLNQALAQVEQLNKDINYTRNTGGDPSGSIDQRQRVIDEISEMVPVRELDRNNGQVALMTLDGETLIDGTARVFEFTRNPVITADMTFDSGGLSGITSGGVPLGGDGFGKLGGGTLDAAFQARDNELVEAQSGLDAVAQDLITRLQDPNVDPTLGIGQAGLLTDGGAPLDPLNISGLAGRISVNVAIDPSQGGALENLRDGIAATSAGPTGNATLLQSLASALSTPTTTADDPVPQSAAGRAASLEAANGSRRLTFESDLSFATARWSSLMEAEAAGGVDTDYEMQMLLRVEQAYAANARVIQTIESLMQTLMEL